MRARLRARRSSLAITALALVATAALSWAAYTVNEHNESRLLRLKVGETGAVLQTALPTIETPMASAAEVAEMNGGDVEAFRRYMTDYVTRNGPFGSASLWRVDAAVPRLVTVVGVQPRLASEPATAAAFLARAVRTSGVSVLGLLAGEPRRIGYGYSVSRPHPVYVVYAESVVPATPIIPPTRGTPFSDLKFALYLGRTTAPASLIEANARSLGSRTSSATISFGDEALTIRAAAGQPLAGSLSEALWWIVLVGGVVLSVAAGAVTERLLRRRETAEALAVDLQRLFERQQATSQALQRALVPPIPTSTARVELAVRYLAGVDELELGGDWYDTVDLEDGTVFLSIGDVSGRGIAAGTVMASLRAAIRAFVSEGHGPAELLSRLSSMIDITRDGHFATALCAVIDPLASELRLASAGHLPPLLVTAAGPALLDIEVGPPIGAATEVPTYVETLIDLPRAGALVLFTDGLVERRGESIDDGLARLVATARAEHVGATAHTSVDDLLTALVAINRDQGAPDDTALLGARWTV